MSATGSVRGIASMNVTLLEIVGKIVETGSIKSLIFLILYVQNHSQRV